MTVTQRLRILIIAMAASAGHAVDPVHLVFVGDSHTAIGTYPRAVQDAFRREGLTDGSYENRGIGGALAIDLLARIDADPSWLTPLPGKSNIAMLMIGTNGYDAAAQVQLANRVRSLGYRLFIITCPPRRGPDTATGAGGPGSNQVYNDQLRSTYAASQTGVLSDVQLIDPVPMLLDPDIPLDHGEWLALSYNLDDVHCNHAGYIRLASVVADAALRSVRGADPLPPPSSGSMTGNGKSQSGSYPGAAGCGAGPSAIPAMAMLAVLAFRRRRWC